MKRIGLALAFVLVVLAPGCKRRSMGRGVDDPNLARLLSECDDHPSPRRDWCALSTITSIPTQTFTGEQLFSVCKNIREPAAYDQCVAHVMRLAPSPPAETCDTVIDKRMRESCWLDVVDGVVAKASALDEVVNTCAMTGDLYEHCLVHFFGRSTERWQAAGAEQFEVELRYIMKAVPGAAEMDYFAKSVGMASVEISYPAGDFPCDQFTGDTQAACDSTRRLHTAGGGNPGQQRD